MDFCNKCNNTGATTPEGSLDCIEPLCTAATDRADFDKWLRREGYPQSGIKEWGIYRHAVRTAVESCSLLLDENARLVTAKENLIQQSQQWAMEARTQRGTVLDILRHFSCPEEDWHALELIKAAAPQQHAQAALSDEQIHQIAKECGMYEQHDNARPSAATVADFSRSILAANRQPAELSHKSSDKAVMFDVSNTEASQQPAAAPSAPALTVWYGPMPESNGAQNFTATLTRKGAVGLDRFDGFTFSRSEYPDRVRYEADCMRHLIGELDKEPDILDYDDEKHSGYAKPAAAPAIQQEGAALDERAAFEVAALEQGFSPDAIKHDESGVYYQMDVRMMRRGWQAARAALAVPAPVQPASVEEKPIGIWEQYITPGILTFMPEWRLRWYDRAPRNNTELHAAQPAPAQGDSSYQQGRAAGIQEAAKAAENVGDGIHDRSSCAAYSCAAAIRALNKQEPTS